MHLKCLCDHRASKRQVQVLPHKLQHDHEYLLQKGYRPGRLLARHDVSRRVKDGLAAY